MGIVLPWSLLMLYQVYTKGIQQQKMPEPYYFYWGTLAMVLAAMVGMADRRLGIALAWAILIGAGVANYRTTLQTGQQSPQLLPQNPFKQPTGAVGGTGGNFTP